MPDDFRIRVGFTDHPKTIKLIKALGHGGAWGLLKLIEFCAKTKGRHNGDLVGMDEEDIEIAAGWRGEAGAFVEGLWKVRYLDEIPHPDHPDDAPIHYIMHDWSEHQPWASGFEGRAAASRRANAIRWHRRGAHTIEPVGECPLCVDPDSESDEGGSVQDRSGLRSGEKRTPGLSEADPGRTKAESPTSISTTTSIPISTSNTNTLRTKNIVRVFVCWQTYHPGEFMHLHPGLREWVEIDRRLGLDGFSVDDMERGVHGIHKDDWDGRANNLTLWAVVKTAHAVQRFIKMGDNQGRSKISARTRESLDNAKALLTPEYSTRSDESGKVVAELANKLGVQK